MGSQCRNEFSTENTELNSNGGSSEEHDSNGGSSEEHDSNGGSSEEHDSNGESSEEHNSNGGSTRVMRFANFPEVVRGSRKVCKNREIAHCYCITTWKVVVAKYYEVARRSAKFRARVNV